MVTPHDGYMSRGRCDFCIVQLTKTTDCYKKLYGDLPHTLSVPGISKNFTILQDFAPLGIYGGHILLLPNAHFISFATICDQIEAQQEVSNIINSLKKFFPRNPIFIFEHGPGFLNGEMIACGGCHVDHAHLHFLILPEHVRLEPIKQRFEEILTTTGWSDALTRGQRSDHLLRNIDKITGVEPYLFIGMVHPNDTSVSYIYIPKNQKEQIESQVVRKIIADIVYHHPESPYWHWRDICAGLSSEERLEELKRNQIAFRKITNY